MNPFRRRTGDDARRHRRRADDRLELGFGPVMDAMAVRDHANRLGIEQLAHQHDGHPRPTRLPRSLRTAAGRAVDILLRLAATTGGAPAHLLTVIDEDRVDLRLVAANGADIVNRGRTRRLLAELNDWADAFAGAVVLLADEHDAWWLRVSLQPNGGTPSRSFAAPESPAEWDVVDVPGGPLFGDGSAVL